MACCLQVINIPLFVSFVIMLSLLQFIRSSERIVTCSGSELWPEDSKFGIVSNRMLLLWHYNVLLRICLDSW